MADGEGALFCDFAAAMARAAPFEPRATLAVALSGGADSSALLLLVRDWSARRGGRAVAVTVDHGLRSGSDREAAHVAAWCRDHGVEHATLRWDGPKPARAIQERARAARYRLLEAWCREAGILHLLLGHHRDDQRETVAMRRAKASGADGLAAMPLIAEREHVRLLRPLLGIDKARLVAWLRARGESWIEDPSNLDPRFLRARLRAAATSFPEPDPGRGRRDDALAARLARIASVHPEGWVAIELAPLRALAPAEIAAILRRAVSCVSGRVHPPRLPKLAEASRWVAAAAAPAARAFFGCRLLVDDRRLVVARDRADIAPMRAAGGDVIWDGRFRLRLAPRHHGAAITPLEPQRLARAKARRDGAAVAASCLPQLRGVDGVAALPHLFYGRASLALVSVDEIVATFRPLHKLGSAAFADHSREGQSAMPPVGSPERGPRQRVPERMVAS